MRQFTSEQIQSKFDTLPKELQAAVTSPEVNRTIRTIGEKHGLLIDQIGELVDMIGLIMLGLMPSKDFVRSFCSESGADNKTAEAIVSDINTEIFRKIRSAVQAVEKDFAADSKRADTISTLETAGGFSIEPEKSEAIGIITMDRNAILSGLENPQPSTETIAPKAEAEKEPMYTDPLIDQLLSSPAARREQTAVVQRAQPQIPPNLPIIEESHIPMPKPPQKSGPDMYRELVR